MNEVSPNQVVEFKSIKVIDGMLYVPHGAWAWSQRTSGFPIWALVSGGQFNEIGTTSKHASTYQIPEGAKALIRLYVSTLGNRHFYIYPLPSLEEYVVSETEGFNLEALPSQLREPLRMFIKSFLTKEE